MDCNLFLTIAKFLIKASGTLMIGNWIKALKDFLEDVTSYAKPY